jgi:hypothetical protein
MNWAQIYCIINTNTWVQPPVFSEVRVTRSSVLCVCFVDRCMFFWPLCCVFFDIRILITPLVSSNSFSNTKNNINYKSIGQWNRFLLISSLYRKMTPYEETCVDCVVTIDEMSYLRQLLWMKLLILGLYNM